MFKDFSLQMREIAGRLPDWQISPTVFRTSYFFLPYQSFRYGCGSLNENVEYVEAMNWALQHLNQNSGSINGNPISDSYVPGIQLGK